LRTKQKTDDIFIFQKIRFEKLRQILNLTSYVNSYKNQNTIISKREMIRNKLENK